MTAAAAAAAADPTDSSSVPSSSSVGGDAVGAVPPVPAPPTPAPAPPRPPDFARAALEFAAYRVLYSLYTGDRTDAKAQLARLSAAECADAWVRHALCVAAAVSAENAARFFALHRSAPNMGSYLMDWLADGVRARALAALCRGARPTLPLAFLVRALGFESAADARAFLAKCGGVVLPATEAAAGGMLDCAASAIVAPRESLAAQRHAEALTAGTAVVALASPPR